MRSRIETANDIRKESRLRVVRALVTAKEATRLELAQSTGLSQATIATIISELISEGLVVEGRLEHAKVGRPTMLLRMDPTSGYLVGIDAAETYVTASVFDLGFNEIATVNHPIPLQLPTAETTTSAILETFEQALEAAGTTRKSVLGVGVALPGLVSGANGLSTVVPAWSWTEDEIKTLREGIGLPTTVENPLKAIARSELWFGGRRDSESLVVVNLGTGVGVGIILGGQILGGAAQSAGEWGHSLLVYEGRQCRCGRRGCVEAYVGVEGLRQTLCEIDPNHRLAKEMDQSVFMDGLAEAVLKQDSEDPVVTAALEQSARYLGAAVADIVAIINPADIAMTGWVSWLVGETLLPMVEKVVHEESPGPTGTRTSLTISDVRTNPGANGMAVAAFLEYLDDADLVNS